MGNKKAVFNINGIDITAPANSVFIYPKGRPQFYRCEKGHIFENDWVHFDFESDSELNNFLNLGIPLETPIQTNICFFSYCIKSIAYEHYSNNACSKQSIDCFMKLIFIKLREQFINIPQNHHDSKFDLLSTIRSKIYSKPYEQRNVDIAAHEIRMSRSAFQRAYKKQFGITFIEDLNKSRLEYSEMLLSTTSLTIEEIAMMSGYKTYVHFIRCFKNRNGITPSEYRKMNQ